MLLAALMMALSVTGCSGPSLSGMKETGTAAESAESGEKRKNAASDLILEGHEIDHPVYGKLIVSGDLWAVCEDVEKETDGDQCRKGRLDPVLRRGGFSRHGGGVCLDRGKGRPLRRRERGIPFLYQGQPGNAGCPVRAAWRE